MRKKIVFLGKYDLQRDGGGDWTKPMLRQGGQRKLHAQRIPRLRTGTQAQTHCPRTGMASPSLAFPVHRSAKWQTASPIPKPMVGHFWIAATSKLHKCGSGGSIDADPDTQLHSRLEGGRCLLIERLQGGGGENGLPGRWVGRGGSAVRCGHGWPWRWTSEEHHLARNVPPTWRPTKCHALSHCRRVRPQRLRPEPTTLRHSRGQRAEGGTP